MTATVHGTFVDGRPPCALRPLLGLCAGSIPQRDTQRDTQRGTHNYGNRADQRIPACRSPVTAAGADQETPRTPVLVADNCHQREGLSWP